MRLAVFYRGRAGFHYDLDWRDALLSLTDLQVDAFDWNWTSPTLYHAILRYDYLIVLHSMDPGYVNKRSAAFIYLLQKRRGKLIYFPRNEYKDFSHKRRFIQQSGADLVCSLLPQKSVDYLYGDLTKAISLPHATNLNIYNPAVPLIKRQVAIGSRTVKYPPILLDNSRNELSCLIARIRDKKPEWLLDYSDNPTDRFDRAGWANFLNQAVCTLSTEAGSAYLDKSDQIQHEIEQYVAENPNADEQTLRQMFLSGTIGLPSGKHITSRHFEAMGCKTCQILVEGEYNGLIEPDKHYIALRSDFSNLDHVLAQIADLEYTGQITERCFELVQSRHLHRHRVDQLRQSLAGLA